MPDNYFIADQFALLAKLMDIHGENAFKARSYAAAAFTIEKLPSPLESLAPEQISSIRGIGDSAAGKISEILETGKLQALQDILAKTPAGIIEMLSIKGLGPKKISSIWKDMQIESIGELLYACNENRLLLFKGFGAKTQQNVREAIEFYLQHQGSFLYADVEALFPAIESYLQKVLGKENVFSTGAYRRQALTLDELEFIISQPIEKVKQAFETAFPPELLAETGQMLFYKLKNGLRLRLFIQPPPVTRLLFDTSASPEFLTEFHNRFTGLDFTGSEAAVFQQAGLPAIPPCLREQPAVLNQPLPQLIQESDIKGIIHAHSQWSDGLNSLEEMALACKAQGYEYLVISDHSKAAAYAGGLPEEKIKAQHQQIEALNNQLKPFRIFKSIECDILGDGAMDYSNEVLATFDLVIASIHSNLKMSQEKAMMRLLRAIENPYTTILGHLTGRLLLSRSGYPVDHRQIIDACAANQVVIELNAHPRRLDIDWSWIPYALEKGVLISIDPDAHQIEGFADCRYGVLAAQKGGLTARQNLSSFSLAELEAFLASRTLRRNSSS